MVKALIRGTIDTIPMVDSDCADCSNAFGGQAGLDPTFPATRQPE
jgi:hypothetical protein